MMKIDWKKGPGYKRIEEIKIPAYDEIILDNGIKILVLQQGTQGIMKMDLIFKGGRILEEKKMTSKISAAIIREGSANMSSAVLAEQIDFYGAVLRSGSNLDHNYMTLSGLSKYAQSTIDLVFDVLGNPLFKEDEIEKYKKSSISKLALDKSRNELMCYRLFTELIFGKETPYGYNSEENLIQSIQREDLVEYYNDAYGTANLSVVIGGQVDSKSLDHLVKYLNQMKFAGRKLAYKLGGYHNPATSIQHNTKNELQSSVIIGRKLFTRHHSDFTAINVLNTILGGYFGSRLMTEIRENQGLTYNISSLVDTQIYEGYFYIETDVAPENVNKTIEAIHIQIEKLQKEYIGDEELNMVKNYLLGNALNLFDGPLNTTSFLKSMVLDDSDPDQFYQFIEDVKSIDAQKILDTANKYLKREDMYQVVIGNIG
jgi:zinc protease